MTLVTQREVVPVAYLNAIWSGIAIGHLQTAFSFA